MLDRAAFAHTLASLAVYTDRRIIAIFFLGFSSGLPLALTLGTLGIWLSQAGVDKTTIGLLAAVTIPYALKFLWAPLMDHVRLPLLTRVLGRRRGWTLATQIALMLAILGMASTDPKDQTFLLAIFALLVSFCSASQDIVIDAYRVEVLEERKLGAGAASLVFGYRMGLLASGAGALYLAEDIAWGDVYMVMAGLILVGVITILLSREPKAPDTSDSEERRAEATLYLERVSHLSARRAEIVAWFYAAVIAPFLDFTTRTQWLPILIFVALYKFGDTLAGVMTGPFMVEIGFTNTEIANVVKIYGLVATIVGLLVGGWLISTRGIIATLWIGGIAQMLSNLMFAVQAAVGHDTGVLAITIAIENLAGGVGTAAFVAYLSSLCNIAYTATQYALLSALAAVPRTILSTSAGKLAEILDWIPFFAMTTGAALPGLVLLLWLTRTARRGADRPRA